MPENNEIPAVELDDEQERTLMALLNLIIPPSRDGRMPAAAETDFLSYARREGHLAWIRDGLLSLIVETHDRHEGEFSTLTTSGQSELIDAVRRKLMRFFLRLTNLVMECYYQHDLVLEAIGLDARAPFPDGYSIDEGDLTLLEPVSLRTKLYRDPAAGQTGASDL